jgi:hypothetical protein
LPSAIKAFLSDLNFLTFMLSPQYYFTKGYLKSK